VEEFLLSTVDRGSWVGLAVHLLRPGSLVPDTEESRMPSASNHRELMAWQESVRLVEMVYRETKSFPREEVFGITAQLRRTAISIPSNIAEGAGRNTSKELAQFLGIANGSRSELDTQLFIASRLGLIEEDSPVFRQLERVGQLLTALRKSVQARVEVGQAKSIHHPRPTTHVAQS
jgi:four helix bundle protein